MKHLGTKGSTSTVQSHAEEAKCESSCHVRCLECPLPTPEKRRNLVQFCFYRELGVRELLPCSPYVLVLDKWFRAAIKRGNDE